MSNSLDELLAQVAGKPLPMVRLAHMLLAMKLDAAKARALCAAAVALAPDDPEVAVLAAEVFSADVPNWHFAIVRDAPRNAAYDAAIRRAVKPGSRVLDIGAGTGLLALMAARAGAAEVVTCEINAAVAERTREIVARNGFADRIRVVAKHSNALEIGVDLSAPADILVSEIVSNNLLSEGVLATMEKARGLLTPDAIIIPARGAIRVALADDRDLDHERMDRVDGFDLSPFNRVAVPDYLISVGDERLTLRSAPADLFVFDFSSGGPYLPGRAKIALTAASGPINGIAQWIALDMDGVTTYENGPSPGAWSNWSVLFRPFLPATEIAAGQSVTVCGSHDRMTARSWLECALQVTAAA
jgi:protein arginine N-methyltransferase 7